MRTTGTAAPAGPAGCGAKAEGLKTQISAALSGLLDRALDSRPGTGVPPRRLPRAQTSELAKELRRLITKPSPTQVVMARAVEHAAGVFDTLPYPCFYCSSRFEQESTRNRHMGRAHREEMICPNLKWEASEDEPAGDEDADPCWQEPKVTIWTPETPGGGVEGDGDFLCSESKPLVTGSSVSECPVGADGRSAGGGGGSAECVVTTTDSARPHCGELPAGKGAPAEEIPASTSQQCQSASGSTASAVRPACGGDATVEVEGLKTHISTAFGGLLERALGSRPGPSGSAPAGVGRPPEPPPAPSARLRVERAEPAPRVRHGAGDARAPADDAVAAHEAAAANARARGPAHADPPHCATPASTATGGGASGQSPGKCQKCPDARLSVPKRSSVSKKKNDGVWLLSLDTVFDLQTCLRWHMRREHKGEIIASMPDASTDEDRESNPPVEETFAAEWSDSGPAESAAVTASSLGPNCGELPSGEAGAQARSASVPVPDSATSTGPSVGLKTHISTALGGLLGRAVGGGADKGGIAHHHGPDCPTPSCRRAAEPAANDPDDNSYRYVCLYCKKRFKYFLNRMSHITKVHSSELQRAATADAGDCGSDRDLRMVEELLAHGDAEHDGGELPMQGAACEREAARRQVKTGPLVCPKPEIETIFIKEETPVETGPHASPPPEIETIFINEETPFPYEWESPDDTDTARDPLSFEEETDTLADDPPPSYESRSIKEEIEEDLAVVSEFGGCIKEDPDVDMAAYSSDSTEVTTAGHTSDTASRTAARTWTDLSFSEVGSTGRAAPNSSHPRGGRGEGAVTSVDETATPSAVTDSAGGSDADLKPPFSYAELIAMAILNSPHRRAKLRDIYTYIARRFPYYRHNKKDWQNSVRHNLSLRECFVKVPCEAANRRRYFWSYWTIDPRYEAIFTSGNFPRKPLWKQSVWRLLVPSDIDDACRPLHTYRAEPPLMAAAASLAEPSERRAAAAGGAADVVDGERGASPITCVRDTGSGHRSTPTTGDTGSASYEERNLHGVVDDETAMQQEKLTRRPSSHIPTPGIICREDNSVCSTDDVSAPDDDFSVFTCSSCLQDFSSKYRLTMHVFTHIDGVEPPLHICTDCGEVFPSDDGLNKHLKMKDADRTLIANLSADTRKEVATAGHTSDISSRTAPWPWIDLSFSEVGSTGTATPDSPHLHGGRREDGGSGPAAATPVDETATPVSPPAVTNCADVKPRFCYAELIAMAIANSPHRRAKLRDIYAYIARRFPYYPRNKKDWRNMVRHNLSLRECFIKVPDKGRPLNNYWTVDPKYEAVFESGIFRRKQLWKQSVPSDTDGTSCEDPPVEVAVTSLSEPSVHRPIGDGDLSAVTFARDSGYGHRSTPITDGTGSVSYEERNLQSVVHNEALMQVHNEAVMQQDELRLSPASLIPTRGINCREDNSVCNTDDVSASDDDFSVFTCSSCLQDFSSKYRLTMHVFTHIDGVEPPSHVCTDCGEVFLSDEGLNKHLKMKDADRTLIANSSADTRKVCSPSDVFTSKDQRSVSFEAVTDELVADIDHSQGQCCESGNCCLCQNKSKLLTTSFVHKKSYKCNACSKSFAFTCYLQKRAVMDSGMEPHKCEVCGKLFPRVNDLKVHLLVHSGLKSLNCDVCGKLFATVDELQAHSAVHLGENPHKCDICGKSFPTPASLRSHAVAHSVVESHKCDDCGKLFARVGKFELHLSAHSRAGTFACSVCSKQFRSALTLKRHMKRHSYMKGPVALHTEQCPS